MKLPIYLDNNSTTPIDLRVVETMMPYLTEKFGNAASRSHAYGWEGEEAVEKARNQIAQLIGANAKEIVFTSGATESINIAIKGAFEMYQEKGKHVVTCVTEHKATLDSIKYIEKHGATVTYLPVNAHGQIDLDVLEKSLTPETILISIMHANNEMGTIHPIAEIGKLAKKRGILFHVDAAQTAGKIPVNVEQMVSNSKRRQVQNSVQGRRIVRVVQNPHVRQHVQYYGFFIKASVSYIGIRNIVCVKDRQKFFCLVVCANKHGKIIPALHAGIAFKLNNFLSHTVQLFA